MLLTGKLSQEQVFLQCRRAGDPAGYRRICTGRHRPQASDEYLGPRYVGHGWIGRAADAMVREAYRCASAARQK